MKRKAREIELNIKLIHDHQSGDKLNLQLGQFPEAQAALRDDLLEGLPKKYNTKHTMDDFKAGHNAAVDQMERAINEYFREDI